ncbi:iris-like [Convolutriloba macropyga]|uniref:iris-like n=1 Tax=Convolutriloba macropyga TaxID=536237 RepID=UPI003F5247A8
MKSILKSIFPKSKPKRAPRRNNCVASTTSDDFDNPSDEILTKESYKSVGDFSHYLFKLYLDRISSSNCVISPVSVFLCMSMLKHGAEGETKAELEVALRTLSEGSKNEVEDVMEVLKESSDSEFTLTSANGLFLQQGFQASASFVSDLQCSFCANVENVDFGSIDGEEKVNAWIEKETRGKICEVFESSNDTIMALINAIYMKGNWVEEFDEEYTKKGDFFVSDTKIVSVDFMYRFEEKFRYHCDEAAKFSLAFFPYQKERGYNWSWEMGILLPEAGMNPVDYLNYLEYESLRDLRAKAIPTTLNVELPKFKLDASINLIPLLQVMGVSKAFNTGADFSQISKNADMKLSSFLQNCFISIDEKGTEAAAFTTCGLQLSCFEERRIWNFYVTSPFLFFIYNPQSGLNLFCGCVKDPSAQ